MGCTSSKHVPGQAAGDRGSAPLPRSMWIPGYHRAKEQGKNHHVVALTSTSYGILRIEDSGVAHVGQNAGKKDPEESADVFYYWSVTDSKERIETMKQRRVEEEEEGKMGDMRDPETVNTWELMQDLENECWSPSPGKRTPSTLRRRISDRSVTLHTVQEMDTSLANIGSSKFFIWQKYFQHDDPGKEKAKPWDGYPVTPSPRSSFNVVSPSTKCSRSGSKRRSFSPRDWSDGSIGLRLLLSPSQSTSSHSCTASVTLSKNLSHNEGSRPSFDSDIARPKSTLEGPNMLSTPGCPSVSYSSLDSTSPIFDPALIATFEKALESVCESDWDSTKEGINSSAFCSKITSTSSETNSDVDGAHTVTAQSERSLCLWKTRDNDLFELGFQEKVVGHYSSELPLPKFCSSPRDEKDHKKLEFLENFELKCPPGGVDKVVLYFTSLRGVRKTFEDCGNLRLILQGLRIRVDERDVWMHCKFRQELADLLGKGVTIPRLFIKGRYIGGAEEVKQLHEDGIFVKLLEGLPLENLVGFCDGCGDARFIPCLTCNGSCKVIAEDNKVAECPECNENGLIMCPLCS